MRTTTSKTATRAREAHLGSERILHANGWIVNIAVQTRMREAAADLNFEEAARLRDEVKRLRATEMAVVDDPTIKQRGVAAKLVTENLGGRLDSYAFRRAGGPVTDLWCTEPGCRRHVHDLCPVIC